MRILIENFPPTLGPKREVVRSCLAAFDATYPVRRVLAEAEVQDTAA